MQDRKLAMLLTCQKVRKTTILTTVNFSSGLKGARSSCVPM